MAAMALVRLALACVACAAALGAVAAHEASLSHEKMSVWDAFYNRAPKGTRVIVRPAAIY